jgi:hypothetical protein
MLTETLALFTKKDRTTFSLQTETTQFDWLMNGNSPSSIVFLALLLKL